jgi:hypothetical protein
MTPEIAARPASADAGPAPTGVFAELGSAVASAFAAITGFLELASLEGRRAGVALLWITAFGVGAALCLTTAWFGLQAGAAIWAIAAGAPPWATLLAVAALNGVAGLMLVRAGITRTEDLAFCATRRQLAALGSTSTGPQP